MNPLVIITIIMVAGIALIGSGTNTEGLSENPLDERPYGYEFLNDSRVIHAWNPNQDYYFDRDTAIQFTNHYEEYWSHNIFCLGYKGTDWEYKCTDELNNFNWNLYTDNSTYVQATGWKDVTWKGYDLRIAVRYILNESQDDLIIQPYVENRDVIDISNDIGFAWRVKDIQVAMNENNNSILVGWRYRHNLSDDLNILYSNLTMGEYLIDNENIEGFDWMRLRWNADLTDYLNISSAPSQYNAPVTLAIVTNGLNAGQNKSTTLYWIDAACKGTWGDWDELPSSNSKSSDEDTTVNIDCAWEGECPAPEILGTCYGPPEGSGYLKCELHYRPSTELGNESQLRNNSWANYGSWNLITSSVVGEHCTRYDDLTNHAYQADFELLHNNFTDFRCRARILTSVWNELFEIWTCSITNKGNDIINNTWANRNTPMALYVNATPKRALETDDLVCAYEFYDADGDSQNTSRADFNWTKNGIEQTGLNAQSIGYTNTTRKDNWTCGVKVYDDVFTTTKETRENSTGIKIRGVSCNYPLPEEGDWLINISQSCTDEIIWINGSLIVNESMEFNNCSIDINLTKNKITIIKEEEIWGKLWLDALTKLF